MIRALALLLALSPSGRPRLARFHCEIGDGRIHILLPRAAEERTDDELRCALVVEGLPRGRTELVAELRALAPEGRVLTVASGAFARDETRARIDELIVPHATWCGAVAWGPRSALLRLRLEVLTRAPRTRRWRPLLQRALVIDHHPRRRPR